MATTHFGACGGHVERGARVVTPAGHEAIALGVDTRDPGILWVKETDERLLDPMDRMPCDSTLTRVVGCFGCLVAEWP